MVFVTKFHCKIMTYETVPRFAGKIAVGTLLYFNLIINYHATELGCAWNSIVSETHKIPLAHYSLG